MLGEALAIRRSDARRARLHAGDPALGRIDVVRFFGPERLASLGLVPGRDAALGPGHAWNTAMKEKTKIQAQHELTSPRCANAGRSLALAALTLVASACSDASDDSDNSGQREGPLYVVSHSIYTDDGATSYLTVVDSLGPGHEVDLSRSVE